MLGDGSVPQRKHPFIYCETGVPILIIVVTEPKSKLDWYKTVQPVEKHTAALYSQTCQDLLLAFRIWSYGSKHDSEVKNVPLKKKSSEQLNQKCKKMKIYSFQYLSLFFFFLPWLHHLDFILPLPSKNKGQCFVCTTGLKMIKMYIWKKTVPYMNSQVLIYFMTLISQRRKIPHIFYSCCHVVIIIKTLFLSLVGHETVNQVPLTQTPTTVILHLAALAPDVTCSS